jgi:hypothetical protein
MRATKLQELEEMAARLLATARKLPPGPERYALLKEIGSFRVQITALQSSDLARPRPALKVKGNTKKWGDPQLDAAQFAIDRFLNAKQTVSEQMAEIYQSIRDESATDEDRKRLKVLREQYIALSKEVEDVMGRLLVGKQLPHPKLV